MGGKHVLAGAGGHGKQTLGQRALGGQKRWPVSVSCQFGVFVVVQTGAAHVFVFHGKTQRFHQVQGAAGVGRQADDVAGVGRDFGLDQNDMKHG